jgi:hypothetical protein
LNNALLAGLLGPAKDWSDAEQNHQYERVLYDVHVEWLNRLKHLYTPLMTM